MSHADRVIPLRGRGLGLRRRLDAVSFLNGEFALREDVLRLSLASSSPVDDTQPAVLARERQRFLAGWQYARDVEAADPG